MSTGNLFSKAKGKASKETNKSKDEKIRVVVDSPDFFEKIEKLEHLQDNMKRDKAKADMISDELRDLGKEEWSKLYSERGKNPGSIILEQTNNDDIAQLMFVPSDKYITINEERAEELKDIYGDDIISEDISFGFDSAMVEKYGDIISRLISECDDIPDKDKNKIITAKVIYSVAKGTIDNFSKYGNVSDVMEAVKPIVSLKNIEIIKG